MLSSLEVQDAEFGAEVIKEWLYQLAHGMENCDYEVKETLIGGQKGCQVEFYSRELEGQFNGELFAPIIFEPVWEILAGVWFCQWEMCYAQNHGLVENEVHRS